MKKYLYILALLTVAIAPTSLTAQSSGGSLLDLLTQKSGGNAFANLDAYLAENNTELSNDDEVIKIFNQERIRLGANFEAELWKYLGKDLRKHYWINSFVEYEGFLNGNQPLPELAKRIRSNAQDFPVNDDEYESLGMKFGILRDIVVDFYHDNDLKSAKTVKKKAERIYKIIEKMAIIGATNEYVQCVYENVENNPGKCKKENETAVTSNSQTNTSSSGILNGGMVNGKAISLPAPEYPKAAQAVGASGAVNIAVVIDEAGNVISAEAINGHALLKSAAVDAAKKAKFKPTIVDGQERKISGIIVYNFNR